MLETREVLDDIKTRFFELDELTLGFTPEQKDKYLMLWVQNLKNYGADPENSGKGCPETFKG